MNCFEYAISQKCCSRVGIDRKCKKRQKKHNMGNNEQNYDFNYVYKCEKKDLTQVLDSCIMEFIIQIAER